MRSVWIATGVVFAVLTLAVLLRPEPPRRAGIAVGSRASVALGAVQVVESSDLAATEDFDKRTPRPLAAEDLAQIIKLRAELAGTSAPTDSADGDSAAFARELRQVAGLEEPSGAVAVQGFSESSARGSEPADPRTACQAILRQAATAINELASPSYGVAHLFPLFLPRDRA